MMMIPACRCAHAGYALRPARSRDRPERGPEQLLDRSMSMPHPSLEGTYIRVFNFASWLLAKPPWLRPFLKTVPSFTPRDDGAVIHWAVQIRLLRRHCPFEAGLTRMNGGVLRVQGQDVAPPSWLGLQWGTKPGSAQSDSIIDRALSTLEELSGFFAHLWRHCVLRRRTGGSTDRLSATDARIGHCR